MNQFDHICVGTWDDLCPACAAKVKDVFAHPPKRSTGLQDRDGREIMEGDTLQLVIPAGTFNYKVEFEGGCFRANWCFCELFCCGEFAPGGHGSMIGHYSCKVLD